MNINSREQIRIDILFKYCEGLISRKNAQEVLELGERQFRRLCKRFKTQGIMSLLHGNHSKTPKNKTSASLESKIITLYKSKYFDFNIAHFREKLLEETSIDYVPCYGTIRRILLESKLVFRRRRRRPFKHKSRLRSEREGLLVQIDGSHHNWFGQGLSCLTAAVDDATGKVLAAKFTPTETTFAAMDVVEEIIMKNGCFQLLYSDKAGIYDNHKRVGYTNLTIALKKLGVTSLLAHSPQAKGRIERLFGTLQDRLCKEMRLNNVKSIEQANVFLKRFIDYYNEKFAVPAKDIVTAYRQLPDGVNLNEIFCMTEYRTLKRGARIFYNNQTYVINDNYLNQIQAIDVEIKTYRDSKIKFFVHGREVDVIKIPSFR